ncbi:MAG: type II toxin-antitoxin system PemK/MazF family toxin [Thermomicrobiales bacterium]
MPNIPAEPRAGEIWNVNFDPQAGREQAGLRPALVISHDRFNRLPNGLHIVVPITGTDRGWAHHVPIAASEGGLTKPSQIMCDQVKSQSVERFHGRRGTVTAATLQRVQAIVAAFIDR